jgi:hypothetical protein
MNYILTMALTRHNVSIFQTPRHLQSQTFLEAHSLNWYRFIGRILGKALYEGILVEVAFAGFFLAKVRLCHLIASPRGCLLCRPYQWLGKQSFLDDLASLDPDLYQGLIFLKHYPGNPEELSLNFTIVNEGGVGSELITGAADPQRPSAQSLALREQSTSNPTAATSL